MQFIEKAGACLATTNVIERRGKVRWMVRVNSSAPADNGWLTMSHIDDSDYLNNQANWLIVDYNDLCAIEPALIAIWDFPVGSDLQLVRDEEGIHIVDTPSGRVIPPEQYFVPPTTPPTLTAREAGEWEPGPTWPGLLAIPGREPR